jgi:hypothetical protein
MTVADIERRPPTALAEPAEGAEDRKCALLGVLCILGRAGVRRRVSRRAGRSAPEGRRPARRQAGGRRREVDAAQGAEAGSGGGGAAPGAESWGGCPRGRIPSAFRPCSLVEVSRPTRMV